MSVLSLEYFHSVSHFPRTPDIDRLKFEMTDCFAFERTRCPIDIISERTQVRLLQGSRGHAKCVLSSALNGSAGIGDLSEQPVRDSRYSPLAFAIYFQPVVSAIHVGLFYF